MLHRQQLLSPTNPANYPWKLMTSGGKPLMWTPLNGSILLLSMCCSLAAHTCRINPNALVWVQLRDIGSFILSIWADGIITHVNSPCAFPPIQHLSINQAALTQTPWLRASHSCPWQWAVWSTHEYRPLSVLKAVAQGYSLLCGTRESNR